MARGINHVVIAGNCSDSARFHTTYNGAPCATFKLASDRRGVNKGEILTTWIKVNVYSEALVDICEIRLKKGVYVIVEGELMNRESARDGEQLTEVRAREIVFID